MNIRNMTGVAGALSAALLALLAIDLQAQLIKEITFSQAEGYTDGQLWGQPAGAGANAWTGVTEDTSDTSVTQQGVRHI